MKIAIISDSHDNLQNINKVLGYLQSKNIKNLIHCGDMVSTEGINALKKFDGKIYVVEGNADMLDASAYSNQQSVVSKKHTAISNQKTGYSKQHDRKNLDSYLCMNDQMVFFGKIGEVEIDKVKIGFTHKPQDAEKLLKKDYDFVFYGHTHKPEISNRQNNKITILANPGNLMGQPYSATFAVLNTENKKLELKLLNNIFV